MHLIISSNFIENEKARAKRLVLYIHRIRNSIILQSTFASIASFHY